MAWINYKRFNDPYRSRGNDHRPPTEVSFSFCLKLAWKALKNWTRTACESFQLEYSYDYKNLGGHVFPQTRIYQITLRP